VNSINMMSLRPVALALVVGLTLGVATTAHAGEDDTPLYLSVAHSILRDSNFSRNSERQAETVNSTALLFGIDKAYGRQTYSGTAKLSKNKYAHFGGLLNNDGKDVTGLVSSEFLRDWKVTVGGNYAETLNQVQDNGNAVSRVVRNIKTYRDGNVALQYGLGGQYAVVVNYDANRVGYSATSYQYNNATQHGNGVKLFYFSSDLLYYTLGQRLVRTHYPLNDANQGTNDSNTDLAVNWQVTGLSKLNALVTRRSTEYISLSGQSVKGWTGNLNWNYTPAGLLSYGVGFQRATGSDRAQNNTDKGLGLNQNQAINNNNVNTTLSLVGKAQLTGKTSMALNYGITRYAIDNESVNTLCDAFGHCDAGAPGVSVQSSSVSHNTTLSLNYAATRSVNFGCSYMRFDQTPGANRIAYDGHSIDCNASLTIQ
jgi:hypothetical protein